MKKLRHGMIAIACVTLGLGLLGAKNAPEPVPDTVATLPLIEGVKIIWVSPPNEDATPKAQKNVINFDVDKNGEPLLGNARDKLVKPVTGGIIHVSPDYSDYAYTQAGELLLTAKDQLGLLAPAAKPTLTEQNVPVMVFVAAIKMPVENAKLYQAGSKGLFVAGAGKKSKKNEIYYLEIGGKAPPLFKKIFSTSKKISAVTGNSKVLYFASDKTIYKVSKQKGLAGVFKDPKYSITDLAYGDSKILFFSTQSGVGAVSPSSQRQMQIMTTPQPKIAFRDDRLFIYLGKQMGVLSIEKATRIKALLQGM